MTEPKVYYRKPVGLRVLTVGSDDDLVESGTHAALDTFFEAQNAAMTPLLDAPGITLLYAENALLEIESTGPEGEALRQRYRGAAEIQSYFETLTQSMASIVNIERYRAVSGRKALVFSVLRTVSAGVQQSADLDSRIELEFDENDLVVYENVRIRPH